jgi:hypothetical protein
LPDGVCRAEESGRFPMTVSLNGQIGEALEGVGNARICVNVGGDRERVVGVAFGLSLLTLRDRHASPSPQCQGQVPAPHH